MISFQSKSSLGSSRGIENVKKHLLSWEKKQQLCMSAGMCIRHFRILVLFFDAHCTTVRLPTQKLILMRLFEPGIQLHENLPTLTYWTTLNEVKLSWPWKNANSFFADAFTAVLSRHLNLFRGCVKFLIFSSWSKTEWIIKSLGDS